MKMMVQIAFFLVLAGAACARPAADAGVPATRPNILLIVAEDMSMKVGAFGDSVARTPSIDALAADGIRYTRAFTVAGVCAPSRSGLITGVYPISMGTQQMRTSQMQYEAVPPPDVKAFPELLRRAGYVTGNVAKTDYQFGDPFTVWDENVGNFVEPPDLALWRKLPQDRPFFVMVNLMSTHESWLATPETKVSGPFAESIQRLATNRLKLVDKVTDPEAVTVPAYFPDTLAVRASIAQMYDNIHYMDGQVGEILANLEADGHVDDTIVIWTTDHGDGFPRAKRSVYDSGLHVPMVIRFPDSRGRGTIEDRLVSFIDLAPTILDLAGAPVPHFIQGRDFLTGPARQYVYGARDRMDHVPDRVRAVRGKRYEYIRNFMPEVPYFRPLAFRDMFPIMQALWAGHQAGTLTPEQEFYFTAPRPKEELYDTANDPDEVENLAGDPNHAEVLVRLRIAKDNWLNAVGDRSEEPEEEMIESMWPGRVQPVTAAPEATASVDATGTRRVSLRCETPGASIGYRIAGSTAGEHWDLYVEPVMLPADATLEAKAIRYGYKESAVTTVEPGTN
ncbi:MAG: sulfatase-like hydrolase/transferase [Woeseiaceae bacterium]